MTEFSQAVREKAAQIARSVDLDDVAWTADDVERETFGRALCQAVLDGALHIPAVELDKARWGNATGDRTGYTIDIYRRLVREGWTPPEPVDPVEQVAREVAEKFKPDDLASDMEVAEAAIRAWIERNKPEDGQCPLALMTTSPCQYGWPSK